MGSELIQRGEVLPNYIWSADSNIKNPQLVYQIHQDYIEAGSNYITTNTFRTTPRAYSKTGLSDVHATDMAYKSLKIAVKMAKKATNDKVKVLGSIAPLEDCYQPEFFPGENIARQEFKQLGEWLKDEGVDIFLLETMNSITDAIQMVANRDQLKRTKNLNWDDTASALNLKKDTARKRYEMGNHLILSGEIHKYFPEFR